MSGDAPAIGVFELFHISHADVFPNLELVGAQNLEKMDADAFLQCVDVPLLQVAPIQQNLPAAGGVEAG